MLVLIGSKDDWTLARSCTALRVPAGAPPFEVKVYEGAHHGFDELNAPFRYLPDVQNANVPGGRGASVGPHAGATEQAKRDIAAFLDKHLAR